MIGCPYCGTPNRKGSKYCSNCGQRLGADSGMVCPSCDELSPQGSTYCGACGSPLLASGVVQKGDAEPPGDEPEGSGVATPPRHELPAWLHPYPAVRPVTSVPSSAAPAPPSAEIPAEKGSKYLQGIPGVLPRADAWLPQSQDR